MYFEEYAFFFFCLVGVFIEFFDKFTIFLLLLLLYVLLILGVIKLLVSSKSCEKENSLFKLIVIVDKFLEFLIDCCFFDGVIKRLLIFEEDCINFCVKRVKVLDV